jgi:hypothetical protein
MRQLCPGPHRPRFPDRGAEGREEGAQGVAAEEALRGVRGGLMRGRVSKTGQSVFMCITGSPVWADFIRNSRYQAISASCSTE